MAVDGMSLKNFSAFSKIILMMHQTQMIQEYFPIILSMRLVLNYSNCQ